MCDLLQLPHDLAGDAGDFPLLAPRSYVARMRVGDPNDPLLRQILPAAEEHAEVAGWTADPVGDLASEAGRGILHKYNGRVLLVLTGACAVNCRYCFRRHYPYATASAGPREWAESLEVIAGDSSIEEVILSGGDPLVLDDQLLAEFVASLEPIQHVRRLRIHTRLPIVIPERVTESLTQLLAAGRLTKIVVLHSNHANELTGDAPPAIERLASTGAMLLNQAVLLRGVNDSLAAQRELCERLVQLRVLPYYLHQLDRVAGAAHFETLIAQGMQIMQELRAELPGYMVPRYVQEVAGEPNKRVLA